MRRFPRLARAPAFAARHRAFAARCADRRHENARAPDVARVLRRFPVRILQRVWMPLYFALQVLQRAAAPWIVPRRGSAPRQAGPNLAMSRERTQVTVRLVDRASRELQVRHLRMLLTHSPAPSQGGSRPEAPAGRTVVLRRIERQAHFPRVTQVVARAPGAAAVRAEAAVLGASAIREAHAAPRAAAPFARPAAAVPLAPAELSRVTDHVIQQLDRRVLSYRERMGL